MEIQNIEEVALFCYYQECPEDTGIWGTITPHFIYSFKNKRKIGELPIETHVIYIGNSVKIPGF